MGVGVSLTGLSTIERRSTGLGAPRGNATDVFVLDGEPLLACSAGATAPGCLAGATHVLRRDNDTRVVRTGALWLVTSPKGIVSTYSTVTPQIAAVTERRDPFGNKAVFAYTTSGAAFAWSALVMWAAF